MEYLIKGELDLEILDSKTLEVKRTQHETNDFTRQGAFALNTLAGLLGGRTYTYSYWDNVSNSEDFGTSTGFGGTGYNHLWISPYKYIPHTTCVRYLCGAIGESTIITHAQYTHDVNVGVVTWKFRYNPPASNRSIWTVSLTSTSTSAFTVAPLATECIQTTTEILDVTYRIQINYGATPTAIGNAITVSDMLSRGMAYSNIGKNDAKTIYSYQFMPHKCHKQNMNYRAWGVLPGSDSGGIASISSVVSSNYKARMTTTWDINAGIGRILQSLHTKSKINVSVGTWNYDDQGALLFDKFGNDSFTNKPIQPVFLHSASSTIPFMDINNVGTSSAGLSINGDNWGETPIPEYYRLDITKSGSVENSAYYFRKRILTGFNNNTYFPDEWYDSFMSRCISTWGGFGEFENTTLVGMHGSSKDMPTNWEEYTAYQFVLFDDTGISVIDITNGDGVNFDATTTPALPVLKVRQVAVNFSNGDIWVACSSTGLYKIQNPYNNPVITKITTIDTITNISNAYAVSLGYNNSIWCIVNGGLASTTDNGSTWIINSFTFTGITNSLWSRVKQIRTDINASTNELAIVYAVSASSDPTLSICWWSTSIGAVAGPTNVGTPSADMYTPAASQYIPFNRYWVVRCSHYGSMWVVAIGDISSGYSTLLKSYKFGTTTILQNFAQVNDTSYSGGSIKNYNIAFYYDYYNVPHVISIQKSYPSFNYTNLLDIRGNIKSLILARNDGITEYSGYSTNSTYRQSIVGSFGFNSSYNKSPLVHTSIQSEVGASIGRNSSRVNHFFTICPVQNYSYSGYNTIGGYAYDELNGKYSVTSEMLWKKYHWNTSANQWQLNYYAPAVDSSSYSINGVRHNFDTESHFFTGRSLIDITQSISSASINSTATFVFTVNSSAKLTNVNQELASTLLAIEDDTYCLRILWTGGTNFEILHGTGTTITTSSISSALTNGVSYRIVVVINGTSCSVYSNGAQLGTTLTMSTSFNFSTLSPSLKAYIGSHCYYRTFNTKTTMPYGFFRGTLSNVQVWNVSWDTTDITNDYANISGVISSKSLTNLRLRLQLTETLVETKPAHLTTDQLDNGITLSFINNTVDPNSSLFASDYYTFGVVDGILKDNATSFTHKLDVYGAYANVDVNFSDIKNAAGESTVSIINAPVTLPVHWTHNVFPFQVVAGQCGLTSTSQTGSGWYRHNMGAESIIGDGEFTFYLFGERANLIACGLTTDTSWYETSNSAIVWPRLKYVFRFNSSTAGEIREASTTLKTGSAFTYQFGDRFTIRRTGTTIQYLKNDIVISTTTGASTMPLTPIIYCDYDSTDNNSRGVINCTVTITPNRPMMFVGNINTQTGCFNRKFLTVEWDPTSTIKLQINGIDAPVTIAARDYGFLYNTTSPAPGQVTLLPYSGILLFNDADVGKTISGTCIPILDV